MKAFYTRNKTDEHTLTHSNFVYLIMNLVLFVVMGEHQGNMRSLHLDMFRNNSEELKQFINMPVSLLEPQMDLVNETTDVHTFNHSKRVLIPDILDSFTTGSSQEDTDLLDFKAQRLQTDSALENITGWRQFSGEDMFRSKEPSF